MGSHDVDAVLGLRHYTIGGADVTTGEELLAQIPEELRDQKVLGENETPRECARHFDETGCRGCWDILRRLAA